MAATAAHELNQPLTTILGFADMAMHQLEETHRARGALDRITEAAERLADRVRELGRLKRIVTRSYGDGAEIVDLEASTRTQLPQARTLTETKSRRRAFASQSRRLFWTRRPPHETAPSAVSLRTPGASRGCESLRATSARRRRHGLDEGSRHLAPDHHRQEKRQKARASRSRGPPSSSVRTRSFGSLNPPS